MLNRKRRRDGDVQDPLRRSLPVHPGGHGDHLVLGIRPETRRRQPLLGPVRHPGPGLVVFSTWAMPVVAGVNIWQFLGFNMLFFLAGLQAIPRSLYEAAELDGASKWRQFWRISLPLLNATLLFVLITDVIGSFQVFDTLYVLTQGGPGDSTKVMSLIDLRHRLHRLQAGRGGGSLRLAVRRHPGLQRRVSSCSSGNARRTTTRHDHHRGQARQRAQLPRTRRRRGPARLAISGKLDRFLHRIDGVRRSCSWCRTSWRYLVRSSPPARY